MIKRKDAIVLRSFDYRNSSKIIHILTQDSKRISLVAKGARRTNSQFGGDIEPLNLSQVVYYIKPDRDIGILKEATMIEPYLSLKSDLYRLNIGWGFACVGEKIPDPQEGLFGLEKRSLTFLDRGFKEEVFVYFLLSLFHLSGVSPKLNSCVCCGSRDVEFFNIRKGGAQCANCIGKDSFPFGDLQELMNDLRKGRLRVWEEINEPKKGKILQITFKYGVYHLGDWLNRLRDILPFDIIPNER
ncbi:MAG: DNA repair protein RecO [candidate division WOR-3 bacterium]|nr:DNA repair protein RecO [candidate division WOR-3 bacterium]